jgi:hypothetical protein
MILFFNSINYYDKRMSYFVKYMIYIYYNSKSSTIIKILDWMLYILWNISYIFTSIKNPGYPKMCSDTIKGTKEMLYSEKC